jgi:Spy/CpxP family protein refolding chaperone
MKRLTVLFVVITLVFSATIAMAGPRRCGSDMGPGCAMGPGHGMGSGCGIGPDCGMGPYALANLNLSAEQSSKIQALGEARLKEVSPLQNQLFSKRAELGLLWIQSNPDQEKITAKQKEISNLRDQVQEKATQYRLELRKVLTSEQKAQLAVLKMERGCCGKCGRMGCW